MKCRFRAQGSGCRVKVQGSGIHSKGSEECICAQLHSVRARVLGVR